MGKFTVGLIASSIVGLLLAGCAGHKSSPSVAKDEDAVRERFHGFRVLKSGRGGYAGNDSYGPYGRLIKQGRGGYFSVVGARGGRHSGRDGAPDWVEDVTRLPDAVPEVYAGPVKAEPYTVLGKRYYPIHDAAHYRATGTASWYGTKFHGQKTANGEDYDLYGMTAAHKTLPLPCFVKVTNLANNRSVIVRVNDRGPFHSDRVIDLSYAAATKLGYANSGTARVSVEGIDPAQWQAEHGKRLTPTSRMASVRRAQPTGPYVASASSRPAALLAGRDLAALGSRAAPKVEMGPQGMYLQVGAFATADAAESIKNKLRRSTSTAVVVDSVQQNRQTLHRVRLGPLRDSSEVRQLQDSLRLANLGQATLVQAE